MTASDRNLLPGLSLSAALLFCAAAPANDTGAKFEAGELQLACNPYIKPEVGVLFVGAENFLSEWDLMNPALEPQEAQ